MKSVKIDCKIITPMFLGDYDGQNAVLRPPSLKGALRFWWRAQHGDLSLNKLREKEGQIFGNVGNKSVKSSFFIRITPNNLETSSSELPFMAYRVHTSRKTFTMNILEYLAYGTFDFNQHNDNRFKHKYIKQGQKFRIILSFYDDKFYDNVINALKLLSSYGGLGSRSRNGYGSFVIENIDNKSVSYKKISPSSYTPRIPKFPAFSSHMKLWETGLFDKWEEALEQLAIAYKYARGKLERKHIYEKRQYIAAPIIIKEYDRKICKSKLSRHAKPYFMNVHYENGKYKGQILYLKSYYGLGLNEITKEDNEKFWKYCKELNELLSEKLEEKW